jgi:predicted  nucleic acid-binding Zn-ribbon protein
VRENALSFCQKKTSEGGTKLDEKLKVILKIQSIDIRFDEISREKENAPKELEKLRQDLDLLKKAMEQDLSTLEELKKERRSVERELEEVEAKFKRSKLRLDEVKSNKEYQAVLKELEEIKEITNEKEELVIKWMEEIEIQEEECAQNALRWEESQKERVNKERQFTERMRELDKEVHYLIESKAKLSQEIDGDMLSRYNRLRAHLRDRVVVPVIEAVCHGCHLGIPPQQYNTIMKGDSTQVCPNCSRMIYWDDSESLS